MDDLIKSVVLGSGGHARSMISAIKAQGHSKVAGVLSIEPVASEGERIIDADVLGEIELLDDLLDSGVVNAYLALGSGYERRKYTGLLLDRGFNIPTLVHPEALVDPTASLGDGVQIFAKAYIGPLVEIGEGTLINTGAVIEHETKIGKFTTIAPSVTIAGRCSIGNNVFVGIGANVADKLAIGNDTQIGAGATVLSHIQGGVLAFGTPAVPRVE
ncbi:NeuD/PglB/VioB family sugar acetyltransferase [Luminiphilus sp.]|nr:NeuD/PglB/VioB family sugar acetyltransferase [Luminiphilus sp.]